MHQPNSRMPVLLTLLVLALAFVSPGCTNEPDQMARTQPLQQHTPENEFAFFPVGGPSDRIAYVIDRSASMGQTLEPVKQELKRSLNALKPNQMFYVVFYSSGPAVEVPGASMLPATQPNKLAACEFIDSIKPAGQTQPVDAIKRAFDVKPTLVYVMTDGEFKRSVIDLIDQLNPEREVIVNTFCVVYNSGEQVMREIARRNGGAYTHVTRSDLDKP